MDNMQQKKNKWKTILDRFTSLLENRERLDSTWFAKIIKQITSKKQNYLLILSAVLIVLIIGIVFMIRGCSGSRTDFLYGKWDLDGTTFYVFDGKGGGALELPLSKYTFCYEIKDGTVSIDFVDDKVRDISYEFTVDSDELTLERKEKKDTITYKLKKQTDNRSK